LSPSSGVDVRNTVLERCKRGGGGEKKREEKKCGNIERHYVFLKGVERNYSASKFLKQYPPVLLVEACLRENENFRK
jgi:hypothetical protein